MLKEGDKIPSVDLKYRHHHNEAMLISTGHAYGTWKTINTEEMCKNKRVVIYALPGVFTPTCGNAHAPQFEQEYPWIRKLGVDEVYCTAVNDPYTFDAFIKHMAIFYTSLLPDGNGTFAKEMGMLADMSHLNYGYRSWRYSMVVDNGIIEKMFVEPGFPNAVDDPYGISSAQNMLVYLKKDGRTSEYVFPANPLDYTNEKFFGSDQNEEKLLEELKEETEFLRQHRLDTQETLEKELGKEVYQKLKAEELELAKKWDVKSRFPITDSDAE